jgi:hypothetical protein
LPDAADQWRLKRHDGRAEAALMALYGMRQFASGACRFVCAQHTICHATAHS